MKFKLINLLLEGIQQDFKNLHGDKLFKDFMSVRNVLKMPYKDMSYWMKKSSEELEDFLNDFTPQKSNREIEKESKEGAKLVAQDGNAKMYFITTYPAMTYYGKGTKWCIAGNYPGHEGRGQEYFDDYIKDNDLNGGYYVIIDGNEKYCVLFKKNRTIHSVWDASDKEIVDSYNIIDSYNILYKYNNFSDFFGLPKNINGCLIEDNTLVKYIGYNKEVIIPDIVTRIGNSAFFYCMSLTSVTIPNSVTSIGNSAFFNCISLTSITIPNSVTSIGQKAFAFCNKLMSIMIPSSVTSIGQKAFLGCSGLTSVTIQGNRTFEDLKNICEEGNEYLINAFARQQNKNESIKSNKMRFKLIEKYTDYGYMSNNIEVASDASDEQPDDKKEQVRSYMPTYKTFTVTIQGKPQCNVKASSAKEAALKCRRQFKDKINILGIKEV